MAESSRVLEIVLQARDEASNVINNLGKSVNSVAGDLGKSFAGAAVISAGALAAVTIEAKRSIDAFAESQAGLAQLDAVLKSTGDAAAAQAAAYDKASKTIVTGTRAASKEIVELKKDLPGAQTKFAELAASMQKGGEVSEKTQLKYAKLKTEITGMQDKIAKGTVTFSTTLAQSLGLIPPVAQLTRDELIKLAASMQQVTKFSDETVLSAETIVLGFRKIGKDVFPDVIRLSADIATRLGRDLPTAALALGKALDSPAEGVASLSRIGIRFTEAQREQIEVMVKSGKSLQAQKFILDELNKSYGGAAEAAGATFGGKLEILKNTINDVEEAIGGMIVKAIGPAIDKFIIFASIMRDVTQGTIDLKEATKRLEKEFGVIGSTIGKGMEFMKEHKNVAIALGGAFAGILAISVLFAIGAFLALLKLSLPILAFAAVVGGALAIIIANFDNLIFFMKGLMATDFMAGMKIGLDKAKTDFDDFELGMGIGLEKLGQDFVDFELGMGITLEKSGKDIEGLGARIGTLPDQLGAIWTLMQENATTQWTLLTTSITTLVNQLVLDINSAFTLMVEQLVTLWTMFLEQARMLWNTLFISISTIVSELVTAVVGFLSTLPGQVLAIFQLVVNFITERVTFIATWLKTELSAWPGRIRGFIMSIPTIVGAIFEAAKEAVLNKMKEMFEGVEMWWNRIKGILDSIRSAAEAAINKVREALTIGGKSKQFGGFVPTTGLALLHAGEFVVSRDMQAGRAPVSPSVATNFNQPITINANIQAEPDWDALGFRLAWILRNSR